MDEDTVREDIGYKRRITMEDYDQDHVYKLHKPNLVMIEYKYGLMAGRRCWIRKDIADDLIRHGKAIEVR